MTAVTETEAPVVAEAETVTETVPAEAPVKVVKGKYVGKAQRAGLDVAAVRSEAGVSGRGRTGHDAILAYLTKHPSTAETIAQNVGVSLPGRKAKARAEALSGLIKSHL